MISRITKIVLPVMLALLLGVVPLALANSEAGNASHVEAAAAGVHGGTAAAVESGHGTLVKKAAPAEEHEEGISSAQYKDFFWRTVNFIALMIILIKFLAKPIGSGIAGRQQHVKEELEDLKAKRDEAERSYKEFEARLAGMEKEMESVVEKAIAQAENEKIRIIADAERMAEDIKRQAKAAVQAELVKTRRMLRDEVADQAAAMAEELIVKNLTPADQVAITEQYLDRVGAVQ
ncbi:MAG: ATP synthase F0 subunit B [Deltaproteobacteria bacterium]|nr:ATP synthase F0 subunit B [Deltaproteobacteria bacterium]